MKTLTGPLTAQTAASQSGWCEVYDIYLKSAIATPWGNISILRLTDLPGGAQFFTPKLSPESVGTQGNAQAYQFWPIKRALVKGDSKFANDKLQITASNVTTDWAAMVASISWYDTPIIIRKISTSIAAPTADDCAIVWSGQIDSCKITETQITFDCSSDLATLQTAAPRENMHTNCRFQMYDDLCGTLRYRQEYYKLKTVGNGSSLTVVTSADLTEDTSASGTYGTDLVAALADAAITASSEGGAATTFACTVQAYPDLPQYIFVTTAGYLPPDGSSVLFSATVMPANITAGQPYYVSRASTLSGTNGFFIYFPDLYNIIQYGSAGTAVQFTQGGFTDDGHAANVKTSKNGAWNISNTSDWGVNSQGFWTLSNPQSGLTNMALKPWINFDFGSAKTPKTWRFSTLPGLAPEYLSRLLQIGHSTDDVWYYFDQYFELPPVGGVAYDCFLPNAPAARYWTVCVRSRWGSLQNTMLHKVQAFESIRHWWAWGRLTFTANTTTVALRNWSCRVKESYAGFVIVPQLPAVPINGDTFYIEFGCPRTFNGCALRQNTANFGGFSDLPYQTIIR